MGKTNGSYRVVFSIDVDSLHGGLSLVWLLAALHVSIEARSCVVSKAEKIILCPALRPEFLDSADYCSREKPGRKNKSQSGR